MMTVTLNFHRTAKRCYRWAVGLENNADWCLLDESAFWGSENVRGTSKTSCRSQGWLKMRVFHYRHVVGLKTGVNNWK